VVQRLQTGRERVDDLDHSGAVKDLTNMIGILKGSVKTIVKDHLGLRKFKFFLAQVYFIGMGIT